MTREEEWADPEIQALLADVRSAIDAYLHKKISRPAASMSTAEEMRDSCLPATGIRREKRPDAFTRTLPETASPDRLLSIIPEEPAA